jgi:transcriptional regulator with XRE-family HTH domain
MTNDVAERLTAARDRADMAQRALARATGIPQTILSRIEAGDRPAKANELVSLAWALGCTVTELTGHSAVRDRARCVARATEDSEMEAMHSELVHYLELDAYLEDQGVAQPR